MFIKKCQLILENWLKILDSWNGSDMNNKDRKKRSIKIDLVELFVKEFIIISYDQNICCKMSLCYK